MNDYEHRCFWENTGSKDLLTIHVDYKSYEVLAGNKSARQIADTFNRMLTGTNLHVTAGDKNLSVSVK